MMEDVLEDRRQKGDWGWVLRPWSSPTYRHLKRNRSAEDIKRDVLHSNVVQNTISQLAKEEKRFSEDIKKEAQEIIDSMGHLFTMRAIRFFGLLLAKSMKRIYHSINVNLNGIESVRKVVPNVSILLVPTHRSYVDFLVISYILFHYNLPLPIIAAGQDFTSMQVMGRLMRHAGAFFIRRSFGKDRLYWSIFTEYVQTHVVNGDAPLEFFVEGTRSRGGKSLYPKFGLLTASVEPFFKSAVPDIMVVPIAISYERTLEEHLYAYELLGVPKPQESTRGLLKALQILEESYGSIEVVFGEPFSFRQFCATKIDRSVHNYGPKYLSTLTSNEHKVVEELAFRILDCHHELVALFPFVLISAILVTHIQYARLEVELQKLTDDVCWLLAVLNRRGVRVIWDSSCDPLHFVCQACTVHRNICVVDGKSLKMQKAQPFAVTNLKATSHLPQDLLDFAISSLLLCYYGNQLVHVFVPESLICVILCSCLNCSVNKEWASTKYNFLKKLFQFEFVFCDGELSKNYTEALSLLTETGSINVEVDEIIIKRDDKLVVFLSQLFEPFLIGYKILCWSLLDRAGQCAFTSEDIVRYAQDMAAQFLAQEATAGRCRILSLELFRNGLCALHKMGALRKDTSSSIATYEVVYSDLSSIANDLGTLSRWPNRDVSFHYQSLLCKL